MEKKEVAGRSTKTFRSNHKHLPRSHRSSIRNIHIENLDRNVRNLDSDEQSHALKIHSVLSRRGSASHRGQKIGTSVVVWVAASCGVSRFYAACSRPVPSSRLGKSTENPTYLATETKLLKNSLQSSQTSRCSSSATERGLLPVMRIHDRSIEMCWSNMKC